MAREGGFFSGSERKDKRIAGNLGPSTPIRGEYTLGPLNKNQGATYPSNVKPKKGFSIKDVYDSSKGLVKKPFFSQEVGQIASATSDLSGLVASSGFTQVDDTSFLDRDDDYKKEMNSIYGEKNYQNLPGFIKKDLKLDYLDRNPIKYKNFQDSSFAPVNTETKVAMGDNLGGYAAAIGGLGSMAVMGANAIKNTIQNLAPKFKKDIDKRINPEANRVSIGDQVGGFLNRMMGISI